jgi:hypothetical protein
LGRNGLDPRDGNRPSLALHGQECRPHGIRADRREFDTGHVPHLFAQEAVWDLSEYAGTVSD